MMSKRSLPVCIEGLFPDAPELALAIAVFSIYVGLFLRGVSHFKVSQLFPYVWGYSIIVRAKIFISSFSSYA